MRTYFYLQDNLHLPLEVDPIVSSEGSSDVALVFLNKMIWILIRCSDTTREMGSKWRQN